MNKIATRPLKAFLCHASGDKPPVRELYKRLVFEGVDAWLDKENLLPGQDWRVEIPRAVQEADVVIIFLSKKSISKEGYVQKEIKFALDIAEEKPEGTIFLIPARLEDCVVPERLSRWQWVDLYEENGFIQLLRSLKLRAHAVGATVQPISYEDSDKEIEQRAEQLYTEGLAAFYTEDWDKACQRFQTILSEHPNHKRAAEKIAEAEKQRSLAKLFAQAMLGYTAENWQATIHSLEELLKKSAEYKDAAQLLRNARKQKQLNELYAEAKTLHAAQKWHAVLKVFEQISAVEPSYPDVDGLLPSALKEVAELKRLADLNDLYSHAVREMDADQWIEARRLLEQVHKSQTGFLETERLLRKVEDEITKVEEHKKRNDQVNTLYEQAHGLLRSKKWRKVVEKLEEIKKLDEKFIDTDEIFTKARTELDREDKETQRQNELAAMYAQAVRLLQEEKYQEALDKWQKVKTIDPKYPDRQWVQSTARKKLLAKPVQIKPRFVIPKLPWMGIVAVIVFAGVIAGVIFSDKGNQNVSPTSLYTGFKTIVTNQAKTKVPTKAPNKTITPLPVIPVTSGYSDPTMYDDFDNPLYEGKINTVKWNTGDVGKVSQGNGLLKQTVNGYKQIVSISAEKNPNLTTNPMFVEARIMLDPGTTKDGTDIGMHLGLGGDNYSVCSIIAGRTKQEVRCWSKFFGVDQKDYKVAIDPGTWHILRIEVYPDTMRSVYFVNNMEIGSYTPQNNSRLQGSMFAILRMNNWRESAQNPVGYIDYVRMGAIEDDPTLLFFDDFSESELNDVYKEFPTNPALNYQGKPNYSLETLDQSTVIRLQSNLQSNQSSGLQISKIFNTGTNPIRLEIRFNTLVQSTTTSIDGFINIWISNSENSRADWFGLAAWNYGMDRNFAGTPFGSVQFDFKDKTWYRLVVTGSRDQEIRASIIDDETAKEIIGVGLGHSLSIYKSGFKIGIMQQMGTPTPATYFPTDVAIDWIRLTVDPNR